MKASPGLARPDANTHTRHRSDPVKPLGQQSGLKEELPITESNGDAIVSFNMNEMILSAVISLQIGQPFFIKGLINASNPMIQTISIIVVFSS